MIFFQTMLKFETFVYTFIGVSVEEIRYACVYNGVKCNTKHLRIHATYIYVHICSFTSFKGYV